ncbi:MAG: sensor histidine kinase [Sedimentitalea sp.]
MTAFFALAFVAIGAAGLLILSSQRSALNQTRTELAHESLSGYFQLSGSVFRTFKQARRDLVSGSGAFEFDFDQSARDIQTTLARIKQILRAETVLAGVTGNQLADVAELRGEITQALERIKHASGLILAGQHETGRALAIEVLEGQVDVRIATLIEEATTLERAALARAQQDIMAFQTRVRNVAWLAVLVACVLSGLILVTLLRRFRTGLRALEAGAIAYSRNDLDYVIDLPGQDELSAVAHRFSGMAHQIQIKQQALEKARQDLELRVAQRTREVSAANAELRESDSIRRQFFADIGHELRTPVTAIRGEAEVALRASTARLKTQEAALKTIVSLSEELTANVSDLFLIAREQAGVLDFRNADMDLRQAVELGVEQMQSLKVQKGAQIVTDAAATPLPISGDTARVAQLVRLLIDNALEHSQGAVRITVRTAQNECHAELSVSDDGPGIPTAEWPRIFDRFAKGARKSRHAASSTGLGLAIAKSITQAHGGQISVGAGPEGGAEFIARFPLRVAS